jgi:hypothetical protein
MSNRLAAKGMVHASDSAQLLCNTIAVNCVIHFLPFFPHSFEETETSLSWRSDSKSGKLYSDRMGIENNCNNDATTNAKG